MRFWPVTLLCAATGCAQIFGLDVTTSGPDANLDVTSLQMRRSSVGATVINSPLDLTGQKADWYTEDAAAGTYTIVPGTLMPMDTFTAPILSGSPPVSFTLPDMTTHFWALPARAQKGNYPVYEHPNPTDASATSQIALNITLPTMYTASESFRLLAVGAWTQRQLAGTELPTPDTGATTIAPTMALPYSSFTNLTGGMTKPRIIASDVVLFLRYIGNHLTGVYQTQFEQGDATDTVTGNLTALTDSQLTPTIDPTAYSTRYSAVRPATTGLLMSWRVGACPGWSIGLDGGCVVLSAGGSNVGDTMFNAAHANPFESLGWKTLLTFTTSSSRSYTYMAVPVPLGASMQTITEPGSAATNLTLPAGLPITLRANLSPLTSDGMMLPLDLTKPVSVDAIVDKMSATAWGLSVYEIVSDGMTASRKLVTDAVTTGMPTFKLPPQLFQVGHAYVMQFRAYEGGYVNAASGDLQTVTLPMSMSSLDGALFTVVAP